ncbi:MAG TPA: sugar transferase [Terracidiphilus sp.]|jgi:sugar transferase EpsL
MIQSAQRKAVWRLAKRTLDLLIGTAVLPIFAPAVIVVWCLIRILLGSPAVFRQERNGLNGEIFTIFKFRTMTSECDSAGVLLPDKLRLTRLGRFLRKTSLDELPQLLNVLRGEMSLVGPRPLPLSYLPFFTWEERRRFDVMPGITGWAQVNGRNFTPWTERFQLDIWYVSHWTLWLDIRILALTAVKSLTADGVVADEQTVMPELFEERSHQLQ